jgi:hypothetical protein
VNRLMFEARGILRWILHCIIYPTFRWFRRQFIYLAVLRPSFFIAFIIIYLPLTAAADWVYGNSMLGNLFVDYDIKKAFWFGFALWGAVWALMLTTCLTLDFARDRQYRQPLKLPWIPNPPQRWVTIPIRKKIVFWSFTALGLPAGIIVVWKATSAWCALAGLLIGGLVSYILMNLVAAFVLAENDDYQVLPWRHVDWIANRLRGFGAERVADWVGRWGCWLAKYTRLGFSVLAHFVRAPGEIFEDRSRLLKPDHFFATVSAVSLIYMYGFIYWLFKPNGLIHWIEWGTEKLPLALRGFTERSIFAVLPRGIEELPPAGFIFALLLPLIWIISALWAWLGRYRFAFYLVVVVSLALSCTATRIGNPFHTYDVVAITDRKPLEPHSILQSQEGEQSQDGKGRKNLIIVAASGGGILAAGWTAQVLTQLHIQYPDFAKELRLISGVSGGSVGAAHYVNSASEIRNLDGKIQQALNEVVEDAMTSSLASTSYGVAFPDFRRAIFPFWLDEEFDRARLLEKDWRRIGNCRKLARNKPGVQSESEFREFCRNTPEAEREKLVWFSDWLGDIQRGDKPAVIFNTTVMETGERIAITPLSTLQSDWAGRMRYPPRRKNARTLSEFLSAAGDNEAPTDPNKAGGDLKAPPDPSKADKGQKKERTCSQDRNGYDIDVWTAARLSATFSYVSPAARAACFDKEKSRSSPAENSPGQLHLIDGGYHDNYGVASALDWLSAALEAQGKPLPFSRIALVEIRAKPDIPAETAQNEWSSTWLGPFWGLFNSWGYAQMSSNDTAVNQLIAGFKKRLASASKGVEFESFVFVPKDSGPLSWHLSEEQKEEIRLAWKSEENQKVLTQLLEFLK